MIPFVHAHPHILWAVIAVVVLGYPAYWTARKAVWALLDFRRGWWYAWTKSRHIKDPAPATDPVYGDTSRHDQAYDAALDPAATGDVRSAWHQDPARAATPDRPPWESAPLRLLPPWTALDLPGPSLGLPAAASAGPGNRAGRAGEPVLPVAASAVPAAETPDTSVSDGGEPVLEGVVADPPVEPDYGYDELVYLAGMRAAYARERAANAAFFSQLALEAAA